MIIAGLYQYNNSRRWRAGLYIVEDRSLMRFTKSRSMMIRTANVNAQIQWKESSTWFESSYTNFSAAIKRAKELCESLEIELEESGESKTRVLEV